MSRPNCAHIKPDGSRCGAYAHGDSEFCFVHDPALRGQRAEGHANVFVQARRNLGEWRLRLGIRRARRAGAVIGDGSSFEGLPEFGSEPFLISIGRNVRFACNVVMITHDGGIAVIHTLNPERYGRVHKFGRIDIRDNCVIGWGVIILPGVTIGPDCVIAAGSVVTRSISPGVLAAGNPAKPVMTVQQYAEWSLAATPDIDEEEYRRDPKAYLMRTPLRGSVPRRFRQNDRNETAD
jgi:acetyltransferase-like isoleucine patch superfamily enzyme